MKKIFTLIFALSFVLYLSTATFAQGRGSIPATPGVNHDRDVSHDRSQPRTEARQDHSEANFESRIERNPELKSKLESMLPAGENLKTTANGFKNAGQFIATLHVSKNLDIPFDRLKAKMVGSNPPMSLGQAIHALKPNMSGKDVDKETDKAEKEAKVAERTKSAAKPVT
jgi:hypothetical protein